MYVDQEPKNGKYSEQIEQFNRKTLSLFESKLLKADEEENTGLAVPHNYIDYYNSHYISHYTSSIYI
jgi:hypothetical protein